MAFRSVLVVIAIDMGLNVLAYQHAMSARFQQLLFSRTRLVPFQGIHGAATETREVAGFAVGGDGG